MPAIASAPNAAGKLLQRELAARAVFSTPGTGFEVSGATTDAGAGQPAAAKFGDIDPTYTTTFAPFSPQRLFTSVGSNIFDVTFFVPGTSTPGLTTGFGAIFSDVDLANTTSIQLFGTDNTSLGLYYVLTGGVESERAFVPRNFLRDADNFARSHHRRAIPRSAPVMDLSGTGPRDSR